MQSFFPPLPEISSYLRRGKSAKKIPVPTLEDLPSDLREVAEALPGLTGTWNPVEIYTAEPKSRREERDKFLAAFERGRAYHPVFRYDYAEAFALGDSRQRLLSLLATVRASRPAEKGIKFAKLMLYYKIKDDLATHDLVTGLQRKDDALICSALQYKYPGADPLIVRLAEDDWNHRRERKDDGATHGLLTEEQKKFLRSFAVDAPFMKQAFEWALREYGMLRSKPGERGFQVVVDRRATAIDVRDKSVLGPTVFIPEKLHENAERLLALMAHEIEGHARQSWNGEQFFVFGGGPLKIDEETLYEGLAMRHETAFREKFFGTHGEWRHYDEYVFGVRRAEAGGSFHDVFVDQLERTARTVLALPADAPVSLSLFQKTPEYQDALLSAWGVAYRVMRGHTDMRNPLRFAMAKDLAYFRGLILDRQLSEIGHGHVNEASISSVGQLRILAEYDIALTHLPAPFKDVTSRYVDILLEKMQPEGAFAAKRR